MRPALAEALATFALVLAGTGAIVVNDHSGGAVTHTGVSLVFGLIVLAMICAFGPVSGAHMNPAVTLTLAAAGRLAWARVPVYVLAQVGGALGASVLLGTLFPAHPTLGATLPTVAVWGAFVLELLCTFVLMLVILACVDESPARAALAPVAIGGTVALEALFAGPVTGASMNPARSLGPALIGGQTAHLWLYLVAPTAGALLALPAHRWLREGGRRAPGA
jgi:aquaporin NIP